MGEHKHMTLTMPRRTAHGLETELAAVRADYTRLAESNAALVEALLATTARIAEGLKMGTFGVQRAIAEESLKQARAALALADGK